MKIAYLCTTFPVLSETFLQREVQALKEQSAQLELYSLWKGQKNWNNLSINKVNKLKLVHLVWLLPYWAIRKPTIFKELYLWLKKKPIPSVLNFSENILGLAAGFILAKQIQKGGTQLIYAAWATMPASAAWVINQLTNIPFAVGAHAYDIFENNGDWLLDLKLKDACLVHTSTTAGKHSLQEKLPREKRTKVKLVRQGLLEFPEHRPLQLPKKSLNIVSVGRLIPKKGYSYQLHIYKALADANIDFTAKIIGAGPLESSLKKLCTQLGVDQQVTFIGAQPNSSVLEHYKWADLFLFTGVIAKNGDRDGLANVICEALAAGLLVITSPGSGSLEAIGENERGFACPVNEPDKWVEAIKQLQVDSALRKNFHYQGRQWVETYFSATTNMCELYQYFKETLSN